MLYQVDTELRASVVQKKRAGQTLREAGAETVTIGPVSVGTLTLLRAEQQHVPDLPALRHFRNWLNASPSVPIGTTAATVARRLHSHSHLAPAMATVLAMRVAAIHAHLATHE